jgi:hypothetical protein
MAIVLELKACGLKPVTDFHKVLLALARSTPTRGSAPRRLKFVRRTSLMATFSSVVARFKMDRITPFTKKVSSEASKDVQLSKSLSRPVQPSVIVSEGLRKSTENGAQSAWRTSRSIVPLEGRTRPKGSMPDRWQCAQRRDSLLTQPLGGRNTAPDKPAQLAG